MHTVTDSMVPTCIARLGIGNFTSVAPASQASLHHGVVLQDHLICVKFVKNKAYVPTYFSSERVWTTESKLQR